ncbi:uncharacterized protein TNCV_578671 [Trichonephila clavipes]|nr:uncharacterized protein TNCV_578671 [Trichonephila clavipes]
MIKNVEFKTPNNDVLQGTNLARLYDDMSEKIVKESEDFEGRDSGWTLDEILRLEVRTNRYSPFRGSSSFIEVPKQIAETKAIINVINKKDSQCFMWSILAALYPNTSNPNKTSSYVPHLNKLNFDGISFPTPLNEFGKFDKNTKKDEFKYMKHYFDSEKIDLLLRKGVFPYDYFDSFEKCKDSCLPPISKFYNKLNEEAISVEDYNHACKVFNEFHLNNLGEYCDLYVKTDVLLLTDLFENFRKICMQTYKLDPCWYFTTPALSWDAMLLHTKVAIELFTDYDMLLFIEKGVRGGISQCCNRYAIANNRYMSNFNPDDEIKYLMYLDANNLYGYAMSKYLPLKDFVWSDNDLTEQDILNLSDESDVGYILEVDLEYPSDLHDKHSDFPLAPENKPPPNCKEPRLLTTLEPKTKYVLHYSNLKLYLKLGDMKEDINLYDTSDYDENNIYNLPLVNKKVIGKMKDENKGNIMTEYVGLKSKMYAYKTNNKIEKRLKGIKKQTIKNKITFEDYKACLFNEKIKYVDMNLIRSKFHSLHSIKQNKLALSYKDDKRFINGDGITTLAHGHWSLMNLELFNEL